MKPGMPRLGLLAATLLLGVTLPLPTVAMAQTEDAAARILRLEKQLAAVQRQLFPGGDARFFEGDIQPPANPATPAPATGGSAISDAVTRLDALERQLATLTGQQEQLGFRLRELERQIAARASEPTAATTAVQATPAIPAVTPAATAPAIQRPATSTPSSSPATTAAAATTTSTAATASAASAQRIAQVRAVPVPATGNEVEDAYSYGYRLWEAKLYPEAQAQLKKVVERFPRHSRASYAQNLLGRAYLDEGKPSLATVAFYSNYKDRPQGDRAPHSLMYMGIALDRLGRKADACKAFVELDEVFATTMPADVRRDSAAAKTRAGC